VVHDPASYPGFYRNDQQEELLPIQQVADLAMLISPARLQYAG
jgi:hypothetical protein